MLVFRICRGLLIALILSLSSAGSTRAAVRGGAGYEAGLNASGAPYEINPDLSGNLWISDYGADEIWQIDPTSFAYSVFSGIPSPSDARRDAQGTLWWADYDHGQLGRLDPQNGTAAVWPLPGAGKPFSIQMDDTGRVWVSDAENALLFRFTDGVSKELCTYNFPLNASFSYIINQEGLLWVADNNNRRLYRGDPDTGFFTYWQLPASSSPYGFTLDAVGNLWFVDLGLESLARFDPLQRKLVRYPPASGFFLGMIAASEKELWFTQQSPAGFGSLNSEPAGSVEIVLDDPGSVTIVPDCNSPGVGTPLPVQTRTGTLIWADASYQNSDQGTGWLFYPLPEQSMPHGLAVANHQVWVVDTGRQMLVRLPLIQKTFLPVVIRP